MPASSPRRQSDKRSSGRDSDRIYRAETTGLIVIVLLMVVLTLVRYWRYMNWSWR